MTEVNSMERSIIKNMMLSRSHKDIAAFLERPVAEISEIAAELNPENKISTYQDRLNERKATYIRPVRIKVVKPAGAKMLKADRLKIEREEKLEQKRRNQAERLNIEAQRRNAKRAPSFKMKEVDYSKMVTVRIDRTTFIYAEPGHEQEAKQRFLKTYVRPIHQDFHLKKP